MTREMRREEDPEFAVLSIAKGFGYEAAGPPRGKGCRRPRGDRRGVRGHHESGEGTEMARRAAGPPHSPFVFTDFLPVMSTASTSSESHTNATKGLPETVGEAKNHPDFEKIDKFSPQYRDLRERYNEEAPLFFIQDGPAWHVIAFSATTEAEGAPLKRLQ